jgi:hypothetical protein
LISTEGGREDVVEGKQMKKISRKVVELNTTVSVITLNILLYCH